ncbi:MAG TPA: MBL fold metallo-hydrolase [Gemmatirosa sp.]
MRLRFLGTGTSFGIPQIGCGCPVCRRARVPGSLDRRTRVGALVQTDAGSRILIDTPPELRLQLVDADVGSIDAVLYTHDHADHTHGIDDLRAFSATTGRAVPAYASVDTAAGLARKFPYIFDDAMKPLPGTFKPEGHLEILEAGVTREIADTPVTPFVVPHGLARVFGYRIGPLGYVTDAKQLPDAALGVLRGVRVLVINGLFLHRRHPTHLSVDEAVVEAARVGAERTYLTHLTHHTSHADLESYLPPNVRPAYDGLEVAV